MRSRGGKRDRESCFFEARWTLQRGHNLRIAVNAVNAEVISAQRYETYHALSPVRVSAALNLAMQSSRAMCSEPPAAGMGRDRGMNDCVEKTKGSAEPKQGCRERTS